MTVGRIFTKIYVFISLSLAFFENRKNSGLTPGQNDDPVTRTWKMTQMTHWSRNPMTKFHVCCAVLKRLMETPFRVLSRVQTNDFFGGEGRPCDASFRQNSLTTKCWWHNNNETIWDRASAAPPSCRSCCGGSRDGLASYGTSWTA